MPHEPGTRYHGTRSATETSISGVKTLTINGAERSLHAATVAGLVEEMGLPAPLVLVELNGLALRKSEWEATPLRTGDRIEILRIAAGG